MSDGLNAVIVDMSYSLDVCFRYNYTWLLTGTSLNLHGPTSCPSAAASAPHKLYQKANDLAREAVGCMGGLGRSGTL
jgi:hypothetical protein